MQPVEERSVQVHRRCRTCEGTGELEQPHCALCGRSLAVDDPWWEADTPFMPCGHDADHHLLEFVPCPACGGSGHSIRWISQADYRARQRRRLLRGVVLLLMGLIPAVALSMAVLTSEPQVLCGSWWYGLVPLGMWWLFGS
jgi:hypothetical protein